MNDFRGQEGRGGKESVLTPARSLSCREWVETSLGAGQPIPDRKA